MSLDCIQNTESKHNMIDGSLNQTPMTLLCGTKAERKIHVRYKNILLFFDVYVFYFHIMLCYTLSGRPEDTLRIISEIKKMEQKRNHY